MSRTTSVLWPSGRLRAEGSPGDGLPAGSGSTVRASSLRRVRGLGSDPRLLLGLVLLAALAARVIWLPLPDHSLIFDESYYVNAARTILGWLVPTGAPYAGSVVGLDPNSEHPPLGKLAIAASMLIFGDNGIGWRFPSVVAGLVTLIALYGIVRATGETARLGVLAVFLLAFDNLALVHSRIGTLDMMVVALILCAAWCALVNRWVAAGLLIGAGTLIKLTALFGLGAILVLQILALWGAWRRYGRIRPSELRPIATLIGVSVAVAICGLWLLDLRFTSFNSPFAHLQHMFAYAAALATPTGQSDGGAAIMSTPWQWLIGEGQITYLRVDVTAKAGEQIISTYSPIDFRGAVNPLLLCILPLALPFGLWLAVRKGHPLAIWGLIWGSANFLPYVALVALDRRVTYLYYFLPVLPAIAALAAIVLLRSRLPRFVSVGYLALYLLGFAAFFPFRQLP